MNRRSFARECLAAFAAGSILSTAQAAAAPPSPTRWGKLRRKLLRSHVAILLVAGAAIGVGAWLYRPRNSDPAKDHRPPWDRN